MFFKSLFKIAIELYLFFHLNSVDFVYSQMYHISDTYKYQDDAASSDFTLHFQLKAFQ